MTSTHAARPPAPTPRAGRIGDERRPGPTASPRCRGAFAFSSRPLGRGMLWGHTLRSPHPYARIAAHRHRRRRWRDPRRDAVSPPTTCPASRPTGSSSADQPVFASDVVRYVGRAGRRGRRRPSRDGAGARCAAIVVDYEVLEPLVDRRAARSTAPPIHPDGNVFRHHRDPCTATRTPSATSSSRAPTRSACRTRRSSGLEAGARRARPTAAASSCTSPPSGCTTTATRSPPASASPEQGARSRSAASAARSAPARTSACRSTRACSRCAPAGPVKMRVRPRRESFLGHVHRHPGAHLDAPPRRPPTARLVKVEAALRARRRRLRARRRPRCSPTPSASRAGPVPRAQRASSTAGRCAPTTRRAAPCAGFGVVQACFAHEAPDGQARRGVRPRPGRDPAAQRASRPATALITGQVIESVAPVAGCIRETRRAAAAAAPSAADERPVRCPGGAGRTADAADVRRGVGFAVGYQEPHVLRGLRRLLDGALPARPTASPR